MYVIQNELLTVTVNPVGATLWSITDQSGQEYLWQGDERYWGDRAPNLFPYIARLTDKRYVLNGKEYSMDIHGFARTNVFEVVEQKENRIVMRMKDTAETYAEYPYHFTFDVCYELVGNKLNISFVVENQDDKKMYFGVGGHPGFNLPMEKGLVFEDYEAYFGDCKPRKVLFSEDCFVIGEEPYELTDGALPLTHPLFDHDAIVLTDTNQEVTFRSKKGTKALKVCYPDMPYLGLWHKVCSDAPYVCIEPWSSLPSRKGIVEDLATQPGLIHLEAGKVYTNNWDIEIIG